MDYTIKVKQKMIIKLEADAYTFPLPPQSLPQPKANKAIDIAIHSQSFWMWKIDNMIGLTYKFFLAIIIINNKVN